VTYAKTRHKRGRVQIASTDKTLLGANGHDGHMAKHVSRSNTILPIMVLNLM